MSFAANAFIDDAQCMLPSQFRCHRPIGRKPIDARKKKRRVIVNRTWAWLMGAGLVRTVENFGTTGERPSHPELLDHLARQFVADGWSIKRLVRAIMLSRTYQLAATASPGRGA